MVGEFKKGNTIYIKSTVGLLHLSAVKGKIISVTKLEKKIVSIRIQVTEQLTLDRGWDKIDTRRSYRVEVQAYEFFDHLPAFMRSVKQAIRNMIVILDKSEDEVRFFTATKL